MTCGVRGGALSKGRHRHGLGGRGGEGRGVLAWPGGTGGQGGKGAQAWPWGKGGGALRQGGTGIAWAGVQLTLVLPLQVLGVQLTLLLPLQVCVCVVFVGVRGGGGQGGAFNVEEVYMWATSTPHLMYSPPNHQTSCMPHLFTVLVCGDMVV